MEKGISYLFNRATNKEEENDLHSRSNPNLEEYQS